MVQAGAPFTASFVLSCAAVETSHNVRAHARCSKFDLSAAITMCARVCVVISVKQFVGRLLGSGIKRPG